MKMNISRALSIALISTMIFTPTCFAVSDIQSKDPPVVTAERTANAIDISKATIRITGGTEYTGSPLIPDMTVKIDGKTLTVNKDYEVNAQNNINVGTASIFVTGKVEYTDTVKKSWSIKPVFGTPWKTDLKAWGDIKKQDIADSRFRVNYHGEDFSLIPDIGDPQMPFLSNNISKMKWDTELGSRIVEVHNGSSLFTGKAGQGPSNLRQYILDQELLETIVAVPEKMFYNTGIGTYLWILSNKKEQRRKGKVQLIDATSFKAPLRKNLVEKNCAVTPEIRKYLTYDETDRRYSKIFDNSEFGYWEVPVYQQQVDENGVPMTDKHGKPVQDKAAGTDKEHAPFTYEGGIEAFIENEVRPYAPNVFIKLGTEKSATSYHSPSISISPLSFAAWRRSVPTSVLRNVKPTACWMKF